MTEELRQLDAEIAEKVFGIKKVFRVGDYKSAELYFGDSNDLAYIPSGKSPRTHMIDAVRIPNYSTDISAAFQVVERMIGQGWLFSVDAVPSDAPAATKDPSEQWAAFFNKIQLDREAELKVFAEYAPTPAMAICKAALTALAATEVGEG